MPCEEAPSVRGSERGGCSAARSTSQTVSHSGAETEDLREHKLRGNKDRLAVKLGPLSFVLREPTGSAEKDQGGQNAARATTCRAVVRAWAGLRAARCPVRGAGSAGDGDGAQGSRHPAAIQASTASPGQSRAGVEMGWSGTWHGLLVPSRKLVTCKKIKLKSGKQVRKHLVQGQK